ncbi:MAG: ectonucleotide pyrophosphatase/phosphodiesterase [Candidatus Pseudobacter hemicellulosilyticus]|uniref:Ectonucleotide pyrophosphatase/phosphodiesterase n=1 Tax=Candidatus Pseudobacter hemicellulosilyticus TaxID=3121375 RepID=A0AAJ5WV99_9BACT|nr:MAG: ectonucleotide pyrophosphatase/phosphodiesterase [Pseudobacter sp.]
MHKKVFTLLVAGLGLYTGAIAQKAKYVILVSIDGFRSDFYRDPSWATPQLQQLARYGAYAEGVNGVFPTVTYPSHTTLITGTTPGKHGILYNTEFVPGEEGGQWYTDVKKIKVETLWEAVGKAGLKSASVSWPVSVGAPIDYNIPEIWNKDNGSDRRGATAEFATPKGLFEEAVANATGKMEMNDYNLSSPSMDQNLARIAGYIIRKYKPNFLSIHLPCTDGAQHAEGRESELLRRTIAGADNAIGILIDALQKAGIKDSTAIIVSGDHGFVDTHSSFAPNVWLAKKGLLGKGEDWKARFIPTGGAAFLRLKNSKDAATLQQVRQLLEELPEGYKKLFRIVEKAELVKAGGDPDAVLALAAVQGITFNSASTGDEFRPGKGGTHGYFPDFKEIQTGFVASGAGIKAGVVLPVMSLTDVAPVIANLLGIELKQATGTTYPGILDMGKSKR